MTKASPVPEPPDQPSTERGLRRLLGNVWKQIAGVRQRVLDLVAIGSSLPRLALGVAKSLPRIGWTLAKSLGARLVTSAVGLARGRSLAILVGAAAILSVIGFAVSMAMIWGAKNEEAPEPTLADAIEHLEAGRLEDARLAAAALRKEKKLEYEDDAIALYIQGTVAARTADAATGHQQRERMYAVAASYLKQANDIGLPDEFVDSARQLLGKSLFLTGRLAECVAPLEQSLREGAPWRTEVLGQLAYAIFHSPRGDLQRALEYQRAQLAEPSLNDEERAAGTLLESQILLATGDFTGAGEVLDRIPAQTRVANSARVTRARWLIEQADHTGIEERADSLLVEAAQLLDDALRGDLAIDDERAARFLRGICFAKLRKPIEAERQFSLVRRSFWPSAEAIAASIEEAELQRLAGRDDDALASYARALHEAGDWSSLHDAWISQESLRRRSLAAYTTYLDQGRFAAAANLGENSWPALPKDRAVQMRADALRAWGTDLERQAAATPFEQANELRSEARRHFREAGRAYEELAALRVTSREYPRELWRGAESFLQGRDYEEAVRLIREHIKHSPNQREPRALIALGEAHLALHHLDTALESLLECIQFHPRHPDTYRARLVASQVHGEKEQWDEARQLLEHNLYQDELTPQSTEWRDSLFALGRIQHAEGTRLEARSRRENVDSRRDDERKKGLELLEQSHAAFQAAIRTLTEAMDRYPSAPQAFHAGYLAAEAHRQAAKWPRKRLGSISIETLRDSTVREMSAELTEAEHQYGRLIEMLSRKQEQGHLSEIEEKVLRNCYFARAECLFDLNRFEDAIAAYSSATNRYQGRPESLEAFVQIARCYRKLDRRDEARSTLEQAKVMLSRIGDDREFARTTRYNRDGWLRMLDWLGAL